jgi:hypothetical protein
MNPQIETIIKGIKSCKGLTEEQKKPIKQELIMYLRALDQAAIVSSPTFIDDFKQLAEACKEGFPEAKELHRLFDALVMMFESLVAMRSDNSHDS